MKIGRAAPPSRNSLLNSFLPVAIIAYRLLAKGGLNQGVGVSDTSICDELARLEVCAAPPKPKLSRT